MRQRLELSTDAPPAPAGPAVWLDVTLSTVEENLALDEALLELAHDGLATATCVRTWMAAEPTIVLGSSSRVDEEIDLAACAAAGVRVVRRPSGGATVVLGPGCLMWSVIAAHPEGVPPIEAIHAAMLEPLAAALNEEISAADLAADCGGGRRVARRGTSDLAVRTGANAAERKVSGNALRVRRHGVLYHGTLLDSFDLGLVGRVLRHPPREPDYRSRRSHGDFLTNLGLGRERIERIVRAAFNATVVCGEWPRDRVARLVAERYAAGEWTGRL
ncbi:MAG: biotin/lipoate A/B protein ligase family protein [Planctomycetia bacterium]